MRLWHYELLPYLSDRMLTVQWGELNNIFKEKNDNKMVSYIYEYEPQQLLYYAGLVILEMQKRNIDIFSFKNINVYFRNSYPSLALGRSEEFITTKILDMTQSGIKYKQNPFPKHHTNSYLLQCYFNIQEKYCFKLPDITAEMYEKVTLFIVGRFPERRLYDLIMFEK